MVTVKTAAKILKVSPRTARLWCEKGILKAEKMGKTWIIQEESLNALKRPEMGRPPKQPLNA